MVKVVEVKSLDQLEIMGVFWCFCVFWLFYATEILAQDRKFFVGWNWKMIGKKDSIDEIVPLLSSKCTIPFVDVVVGPPAIYLDYTRQKVDAGIGVAGQNCYKTGSGTFTGDISAEMIKDVGGDWVILGQSERRVVYGESDQLIGEKVRSALETGLKVILCIGETLEEREADKTEEVVNRQMLLASNGNINEWANVVIAYEPIWAKGTGKTATPKQVQKVHQKIRNWVSGNVSADDAKGVRIIYGGSVNASNCKELAGHLDIDGFLVSGTSLREEFVEIINARS